MILQIKLFNIWWKIIYLNAIINEMNIVVKKSYIQRIVNCETIIYTDELR